jgi:hypothetical protein
MHAQAWPAGQVGLLILTQPHAMMAWGTRVTHGGY